jgi:ribosome biogenesis protein MAK21
MQPAASANDRIGVKLLKGESSGGALPNEEKFLNRRLQDVPVDEVFFHKFFSRKREKDKNKTAHTGKKDSDAGESDDASDVDASASELEEAQDRDADDAERDDHSEDDEDSDAEEADIWKAMQASMPRMAGDEDLMEDSDSVASDLDDSDGDDEEVEVNGEDEDEDEDDDEDGGSGDDFSMVEASDNEDLLSLDEVPRGLIEYDGIADEDGGDVEEEWNGFGSTKKRKQENESKREKRKKLRSLPTFASYDDYAKMIEDGPEDDI